MARIEIKFSGERGRTDVQVERLLDDSAVAEAVGVLLDSLFAESRRRVLRDLNKRFPDAP